MQMAYSHIHSVTSSFRNIVFIMSAVARIINSLQAFKLELIACFS